jgi:hypothetical protein
MSSGHEVLPFPRGTTFGTTDTAVGNHLEGQEYWVDDIHPTTKVRRSPQKVCLKIVRNSAVHVILPKRVCRFKASNWGREVDGYVVTQLLHGAVADEYLPSTGAAINDLFYVCVEGMAIHQTALDDMSADIAEGANVVAASTNVTSGNTRAGRVHPFALGEDVGSTTHQTLNASKLQFYYGVALSAKVTSDTGADILINVRKRF